MSNKAKTISMFVVIGILLIGMVGIILQVFTPYKITNLFGENSLKATTEEEMQGYLTAEYEGKSVYYGGETVEKVHMAFETGDCIDSVWFDTSVNIDDFVLNLDWENPHAEQVDVDTTQKCIYLILAGEATIEDVLDYMENGGDSPKAIPLLTALYIKYDNYEYYTLLYGGSTYIWSYDINGSGELPFVGWSKPQGDTGFPFFEFDSEIPISDIHPALLNNKALFIGTEIGDVGFVETVYETGASYLVVVNENDYGHHFEKIDVQDN